MPDRLWYCTRQRAGPLVKESRALRPRLSAADDLYTRTQKNKILRPPSDSSVCRSRVDRLELRLALFGFEGSHYTLTFNSASLPRDFQGVRKSFRAFSGRIKRWRKGRPYDYIYCIEGLHGDHRYHIHTVFRDSDFSPAEIRYLWKYGDAEDEPVLRKEGGYRRLAVYFNKERTDGFWIPVGRHPWSCSRSLSQAIPPPERWMDESGSIYIPDDVIWSRKGSSENDFGSYYYGSFILPKHSGSFV